MVGEPFSQWVIEDAFRGRRPAWEAAGALLVPDTRPYEAMKLRLLNGGHSALAYLGLLRGHETVAEAVADPELRAFLERLLATELAPTLGPVPGIDVAALPRRPARRAGANPRIAHRLEQIGTDGAMKLPPRLLAPARELLADGREPAADLPRGRGLAAPARRRAASAGRRGRGGDRGRRRRRAAARPRRPSGRSP